MPRLMMGLALGTGTAQCRQRGRAGAGRVLPPARAQREAGGPPLGQGNVAGHQSVRCALLKSLQTLRPGQSFRFPWRILPTEISHFALRPIDVSAVFSVNLTPGVRGGQARIVSSELRITDPAGSAPR